MVGSVAIAGLVLAVGSVAVPQWAAAAQPVVQVVTVTVNPGKLEPYRQELEKVPGVLPRLGSRATMRVWNTTAGETDTGQVLVGLEYPDQAAWAADAGKLQADAEWQKIQAGLSGMRTVVSHSVWRGLSLEASSAGAATGSIAIGIEYPDDPAHVAAQEKLGADAEWQKLFASLDDLRTLEGR